MKTWLERRWYSSEPSPLPLRPLSHLYAAAAAARRERGRVEAAARPLPVPVIVVGNITVGGTGKTPLVIWLVDCLRRLGCNPGVISRGYGGRAPSYPLWVTADTPAAHAGDEPALIARRLQCPVVVSPDRLAALDLLLARSPVDVVVADDGLQHYRLPRSREICVVDGQRGLGNEALLPAGPLREPPARLQEVDLVVVNGGPWAPAVGNFWRMRLVPGLTFSLSDENARRPLSAFAGGQAHAVAGIGNPDRFFGMLRQAGIEVIPHPFPDHHRYLPQDLVFGDELPVLMTEKDAVKCRGFAGSLWMVPVEAALPKDAEGLVRQWLSTSTPGLLKT